MSIDSGDPLERMTPAEVIGLARELVTGANFRAEGESQAPKSMIQAGDVH
jgi:hypothetical protein